MSASSDTYTDFSKKTVAVTRGGAGIGDFIQCLPVFRRIKEAGAARLDVYCWPKNDPLIANNPYVDNIIHFEPDLKSDAAPVERKKQLRAHYNNVWREEYDVFCDLTFSVEVEYMYRITAKGVYCKEERLAVRREKARGVCWYEDMCRRAGLAPQQSDRYLPEFYFSEKEDAQLREFAAGKGKKKWIMWNPVGSTPNKWFNNRIMHAVGPLIERFPHVEHFFVGSIDTRIQHPRMHFVGMDWGIRQCVSYMRAMDLVVGVESFVLNAAGAFDVPKIGIYTHGWPESIGKHFVNHDYVTPKNLQCSPCYMIPVDYSGVWDNQIVRLHSRRLHNYCTAKNDADPYQPAGYKCVNQVDMKELQHKVIRVIRGKTKKETANEKIQTQQLAG